MTKASTNYAFIDSQNLNLGVRSLDWRLDYKKLRLYLKNKYNVDQAFIFIGMVSNNQRLCTDLQKAGFVLVFKPTVRYFENGKQTVKGNVDAELVLHAAAIQYKNYDKAIIVSGDGDFACLIEFLADNGKLLHVLAPNRKYSKLLKPFSKHIVYVDSLKKSLEYKKTSIGGRSKP
ncbi:MAG TPA: NYN domain-containing protein [Patescibacteria group bacterium]|nr:NYN domain-containing protein [Patescibacteria group bacterium]